MERVTMAKQIPTKDLDYVSVSQANHIVFLDSDSSLGNDIFVQKGVYRVLIGSRNMMEEYEFLGDLETVDIPTVDELVLDYSDEDRDLIEEFYNIDVDLAYNFISFSYTEEECEYWVKVDPYAN
jgi:hypothetical protein